MTNAYNFAKSIKDKEQKILNYYKRINNVKEPKIFAVPKVKKGTKKNISRDIKLLEDKDEKKEEKSEKAEKDEKKLTKKRIVIMDD
jgi:hypothetical protein